MDRPSNRTKGLNDGAGKIGFLNIFQRMQILICLILTLALPSRVDAANTFFISSGNVEELIAAINQANMFGDAVIVPEGVYTLRGPLPTINASVTFQAVIGRARIERSPTAPKFRILTTNPNSFVYLSNIDISGGETDDDGGGILNKGSLSLVDCTVSHNTSNGAGGGIWNDASLIIIRSTISDNQSAGHGGGIYNHRGVLDINLSTISSNESVFGGGGGIVSEGGKSGSLVENSTVSHNIAGGGHGFGGGIFNVGTFDNVGVALVQASTLRITNSTISSNRVESTISGGGGIANGDGGTLTLNNVTTTNNIVNFGSKGGGILNSGAGTIQLSNTIIVRNAQGNFFDDCSGTLTSLGFNLLRDPLALSNCNFIKGEGDQVGGIGLDKFILGPLQRNGGPTETHALIPFDPSKDEGCVLSGRLVDCAIDSGNSTAPGSSNTACETFDQRRLPRPFGATCDIGAFEFGMQILNSAFQPPVLSTPTRSSLSDTDPCSGDIFDGLFSFNATFTNTSNKTLSKLVAEVRTLTNLNKLRNADGGPGGEGAHYTFPLPRGGPYSNGFLDPGQSVPVPFDICVYFGGVRFTFFVDVLGVVR